jgi:hypothetical protein
MAWLCFVQRLMLVSLARCRYFSLRQINIQMHWPLQPIARSASRGMKTKNSHNIKRFNAHPD